MKRTRAFTLIELLVVIAIIAVLMGILMPALHRVKEQARQRSCATRVRQHVLTLHMYADDNQGRMPGPPDAGYWLWDIHIDTVNFMLKTGLTQELFFCPSNDNQQKYQDLFWEFGDNQWDGKKWNAQSLGFVVHGHSCDIRDVNGDGHADVFIGEMGSPGAGDDAKTYIWYGDGQGNLRKTVASHGQGIHEGLLSDLDGDGDLDILMKPYNHRAPRIDILLNSPR